MGSFHFGVTLKRRMVRVAAILILIILAIYTLPSGLPVFAPWNAFHLPTDDLSGRQSAFITSKTLNVLAFANKAVKNESNCTERQFKTNLQVSNSIYLFENLFPVAVAVNHPLVHHNDKPSEQSLAEVVNERWARMSGSSVWLPDQHVYLTVSRILFYEKGVKRWPRISFLRAQLYDAQWKHLSNHTLERHGAKITFPCTLDILTPFTLTGSFYGPEDPRVSIEHGRPEAEPIVIFNMIEDAETSVRSMYAFRPFSNLTTRFQINGQKQRAAEKNWAPFFMPPEMVQHSNDKNTQELTPQTQYLYFVYDYHPLKILRCSLGDGHCQFSYEQDVSQEHAEDHKYYNDIGSMRGGTNFELLPRISGSAVSRFVAFSKTHINVGCGELGVYRPELVIMATDGRRFWLEFVGTALDFDATIFTPAALKDPCGEGRILVANSITKAEFGRGRDLLTVTFSVGDATVQVAEIQGVAKLANSLSVFGHYHRTLDATSDILMCSVKSATTYALAKANELERELVERHRNQSSRRNFISL